MYKFSITLSQPGPITFGVCDGRAADNSGGYTITVQQKWSAQFGTVGKGFLNKRSESIKDQTFPKGIMPYRIYLSILISVLEHNVFIPLLFYDIIVLT